MLRIKYNYDISQVSYIKVGGRVKLYIETDDISNVKKILKISKKIKYIGNTSNIFFSFYYSEYIFIKYINSKIIIDDFIYVGSSVSLKFLSNILVKNGIEGFEKLEGIPGLIGGSIVNNASCYNQQISEKLVNVTVLNELGEIQTFSKKMIDFTYHSSSLKDTNYLIIEAKFEINFEDVQLLLKKRNDVKEKRMNSQPYNKLTLGSTFKRCTTFCVPKLLEELGVKGLTKNNSSISKIHSNFLEIGKKEKIENIIYLIEEANRLLYNKLGYYIDLEIEKIRGKR